MNTVLKMESSASTPRAGARARARDPLSNGVSGPLQLSLDLIDEDPAQPRAADNPGFAPHSLAELADSIRQRGVKTPISVRPHPNQPRRFMINHGARRFRASKLAGNSTIPAFVDDDYSRADQVVENLHRNDLTAREIAEYIGRELARGLRKADIARQISKSAAFVTQHAALLDLPDALTTAFTSGRVRDVTLINELLKAYKARPADVASWLSDVNQEVTRGTVQILRAFVAQRRADGRNANGGLDAEERESYATSRARSSARTAVTPAGRIVLRVAHAGRIGQLMLRRKPSSEGLGWVRYEDDASACEVPLDELRLLSIAEC